MLCWSFRVDIKMSDFEEDLIELFGERISKEDDFALDVWAAMIKTIWVNTTDGSKYEGSWRWAGDFITELNKKFGNYVCMFMKYSKRCGKITDEIHNALKLKGWEGKYDKDYYGPLKSKEGNET